MAWAPHSRGIECTVAIYAIGDIQGCYDSLQALLAKLPLTAQDEIWLCGDLVNRGPRSVDVLRWAVGEPRVVAVLGNHDIHLLSAAAGGRKNKSKDTFSDVLVAEDRELLLDWLVTRPLLHRGQGAVLVHAGLHPLWDIALAETLAQECQQALQSSNWRKAWKASRPIPPVWSPTLRGQERLAAAFSVLVGIRTVYNDHRLDTQFAGPPARRPAGSQPWFTGRRDEEVIVFGHWAALGLHLSPHAIGLDTGCVWGNSLTAVRLHDRKVFQQEALESSAIG